MQWTADLLWFLSLHATGEALAVGKEALRQINLNDSKSDEPKR